MRFPFHGRGLAFSRALRQLAGLTLAVLLPAGLAQAAGDAQQVERGRYLARIANCAACHTSTGGKPFAGGLPIRTAVGTLYSTNITPDAGSGIGAYTLAEFDRAVRHGVARDGKRLYPAMPYPSYARMQKDDVAALYAYLRAEVAPVAQRNPAPQMRWPFGMRGLLAVWNVLFLDDDPVRNDPARDAAWNRGAYLVQAVAHCGACHTPRGTLFAEKGLDERSRHFLAGASVEGWSATNLTGDQVTGLGAWSRADIAEFLRTGRNAHATSFGPMSTVVSTATQYMSPADLDAVAAYLKSLPGARGEDKPFRHDPATAQQLRQGRFDLPGARQYAVFCMPCHGADGKGFARVFPPLAGNPTVADPDPASLVNLLLDGAVTARVATAPSDYHMPGYGWTLDDQELANVLTFIRGSWGNRAAPVAEAEVAARRRALAAQRQADAQP
ncbi:putative three-component membrane-bound alcohol deshydrogenase, cytochrome c subunit (AdhB) [Cupriavidus phytorum]|uniref:Three-component membrane-bound alcohol deshydrogenase, cytochrome c subunit (AdhB) n=2 Tax=Cupriavidus TaxID=106589 RepID=A0A975WTJ9_9BURK|nr:MULTISPECIES: cytochrome c [Cupriavidus]PZX24193.1 mono/diheme cytochrome c family protein [Cupriavidus alkaliphilus]SOY42255.1 putative three-component membrane-bound alcohol deshydrogenase, cytochrome c subunit (AdhB) [Cupriavidus taiwanensis]